MIKFSSYKDLKEQYKKENPPDFNTHANYIKFLSQISEGIELKFNVGFKNKIQNSDRLLVNKKVNLIKFTLLSVKEELKIISKNIDFAVVCCSWVPVKSYYVIFNSLLLLKYLIICDKNSFSSTHREILGDFKCYIERQELEFNKSYFNKVYKGKEIKDISDWTSVSGENIKKSSFVEEDRLKHILKKIIDYKKDEFKRIKSIKRLGGKTKEDFLNNIKINLCDFFYCYRIKANYGGLDFLDKEIPDYKFKDFYISYYKFLMNYYNCLKNIINQLSIIRMGEKIIK